MSEEEVEANYQIDEKFIFLRLKSVANAKRNSKLILMQISRRKKKKLPYVRLKPSGDQSLVKLCNVNQTIPCS